MAPERFLVPIDFSPDAEYALHEAIALGVDQYADLILLHVRDGSELNPWAYSGAAEAATRAAVQAYLEPVKAAGLTGEAVMVHGEPWRKIIEIAHQHKATLIVMGTHGRSGLQHLLLGSVAERVVHHATNPVLVTRRPVSTAQTQMSPS